MAAQYSLQLQIILLAAQILKADVYNPHLEQFLMMVLVNFTLVG